MIYKRIVYALLYKEKNFFLSRNFRLQKVGDINWLKDNYSFGKTCEYVDEIIILHIEPNPSAKQTSEFIENVNKFKERVFVPIVLGGGIKTLHDAKIYFENGADKVSLNTVVHNETKEIKKISELYGAQSLTFFTDYKKIGKDYYTFKNSGKTKSFKLNKYIGKIKQLNFGEIIFNSIDKDGTGFGFDHNLIKKIPNNLKNPILIMGGAGKPEHFAKILKEKKVSGAVTANLFNFLGDGLFKSRDYSIQKGLKLIEFSNLDAR